MKELLASKEFLSALVGALLGGALSLLGVFLASHFSLKQASDRDRTEQQRLNIGLLRSLQTELKETWGHWLSEAGKEVRKRKVPWPVQAKINYDFFTFYHSNADKLGSVANDELRVLIVRTYTKYKVFNETLLSYSELVEKGQSEENLRLPWLKLKKENKAVGRLIQRVSTMIDEELLAVPRRRNARGHPSSSPAAAGAKRA